MIISHAIKAFFMILKPYPMPNIISKRLPFTDQIGQKKNIDGDEEALIFPFFYFTYEYVYNIFCL